MGTAALYIIGLGPGDASLLAPEALHCLQESQVLVGYQGYMELLDDSLTRGRECISTGMMQEVARANAAIDAVLGGKTTSVVCSGDPGIYALAGLVLELLEKRNIPVADVGLHVVPGIPAVCAAAARLGAPLMHDFACISLSDLLTPWSVIQKRLMCAFEGDFVVALYNPRSKRRASQLDEAIALAQQSKAPTTPVGIVRNACRVDESVVLVTLGTLDTSPVDMFTIVLIGNSCTRIVPGAGEFPLAWANGARMLTPRGYAEKYDMNI